MASLRRLPRHVALDTVVHYAGRTAPATWRPLALALANQRWARAVRRGSRSSYWWRRLDAGRLLSIAGRPVDAPILVHLLGDSHPAVVISVLGALEQVQTPALLAAVLERLPHLAPTVQAYAAVSLRRVRQGLLPVLTKYLTDNHPLAGLSAYVELAGRLAAPELNGPITWLADHSDFEVRTAVARALGLYPGSESVEALRRLAEDRVWQVRAQAFQSLGKIRAPLLELFQQALRDPSWWVRLRGALALSRAGPGGRDALLKAEVGGDAFARDMARLILGLPAAALEEYQR
jgi:HEAT repeat protein